MKKTKFAAVIAFMTSILGKASLPKDEKGVLALTEEEDAKLQQEFGSNYESAKKAAQEVLDEEAGLEDQRKAANEALAAALTPNTEGEASGEAKPIEENAQAAAQVIKDQKATIDKMVRQPEPDEAVRNLTTGMKNFGIAAMLSLTSATALFGMENHKEFSMSSPWNKRASAILQGEKQVAETDFTDTTNVARLNDDLKEYYVRNPQVLHELRKNTFGLPEFWPKVFNVVDQISDAVIDVNNVTQSRKPEWSPNPDFLVDAEKRKNYPVQIDVQFTGYELQKLETSWINTLMSMDGSSPYKLSFIAYLVQIIDKQARIEDRISSINGVYVYKPAGIKTKGSYLNRQNGLRYQLFKFRDIEKKIVAFKSKLGALTLVNAYDYFVEFAAWLPDDVRKQLNLKIYISQQYLNAYQRGYKDANGLHADYTGNDVNHIEGYSNLEFCVLTDLEGSNVYFMTDDKNIEILEDVPNEKSIYRIEQLKRDTFIHADYKQACAFVFAGFKLPANSSFLGQAQFIWMNDAPLFSENFTIPMYGNVVTNTVQVDFTRVKTDRNLLADVNTIDSILIPGQIIKIEGNKNQLTTAKIKKATGGVGNLELSSDFDPKTGGSLTLLRTTTGWKEVARTSAPAVVPSTTAQFAGTTIDAKDNTEFIYKGTAAATLSDVLNGVEGSEVKIYGQATNALTVAAVTGKIVLTGSGSAVLDAPEEFIILKKFDGIWVEIARG